MTHRNAIRPLLNSNHSPSNDGEWGLVDLNLVESNLNEFQGRALSCSAGTTILPYGIGSSKSHVKLRIPWIECMSIVFHKHQKQKARRKPFQGSYHPSEFSGAAQELQLQN